MKRKRQQHQKRNKYFHSPTRPNPDAEQHRDKTGKRIRQADRMTIEERIERRNNREQSK